MPDLPEPFVLPSSVALSNAGKKLVPKADTVAVRKPCLLFGKEPHIVNMLRGVLPLITDDAQNLFLDPFLLPCRLNLLFVKPFANFNADFPTCDGGSDNIGKIPLILWLIPLREGFACKLWLDSQKGRK